VPGEASVVDEEFVEWVPPKPGIPIREFSQFYGEISFGYSVPEDDNPSEGEFCEEVPAATCCDLYREYNLPPLY